MPTAAQPAPAKTSSPRRTASLLSLCPVHVSNCQEAALRHPVGSTLPFIGAPSCSFFPEQRSHSALVRGRLERVNEIAKPLGENFRTKLPIVSHSGRSNVMTEKTVPAFKQLFIHQSVNIMEMNRLERFQELIHGMKKARAILDRQRAEVLESHPPDPFQFRVLH